MNPRAKMEMGSARSPRAGLGGPPNPPCPKSNFRFRVEKLVARGFRRAAENSTPAACAPHATPSRPEDGAPAARSAAVPAAPGTEFRLQAAGRPHAPGRGKSPTHPLRPDAPPTGSAGVPPAAATCPGDAMNISRSPQWGGCGGPESRAPGTESRLQAAGRPPAPGRGKSPTHPLRADAPPTWSAGVPPAAATYPGDAMNISRAPQWGGCGGPEGRAPGTESRLQAVGRQHAPRRGKSPTHPLRADAPPAKAGTPHQMPALGRGLCLRCQRTPTAGGRHHPTAGEPARAESVNPVNPVDALSKPRHLPLMSKGNAE